MSNPSPDQAQQEYQLALEAVAEIPLQTYTNWSGTVHYLVPHMPAGSRYRPGYLNSVEVRLISDDSWSVAGTDGYGAPRHYIYVYATRPEAERAMRAFLLKGMDKYQSNYLR